VPKLLNELPGILNWALAGLRDLPDHGEQLPERMQVELDEYRQSEDSLGLFLEDCCTTHNQSYVKKGELYKVYQKWATDAGEFVLTNKGLTKKLSERGIKSSRNQSARTYLGICLK
jgi:putative DNA primase/helicase